ncbi:MAG: phage head-tail adapter protein [Clostridiales bacterium]|nr:phage head-tail adapter protein [Clostridiales bacterium]
MNKEWSELNKSIQNNIGKKETFSIGIAELLSLRNSLMDALNSLRTELRDEQFSACPFINTNGYHNKTIAYSIWHVFRIEDIVAHSVINDSEQVFFANDYSRRMNAPITTTGNELEKEQIVEFSRDLNIDELYNYAKQVKASTEDYLNKLSFEDLRTKPTGNREKIENVSVAMNEYAEWLIDYWFYKDIKGLILMPFSRHWIMHIEAALRIKNKLLGND